MIVNVRLYNAISQDRRGDVQAEFSTARAALAWALAARENLWNNTGCAVEYSTTPAGHPNRTDILGLQALATQEAVSA